MNNLKVMTVLGTRPEIIRLSRVMALLDQFTQHCIVHTGQNWDYELNEVFFTDLDLATAQVNVPPGGTAQQDVNLTSVSRYGQTADGTIWWSRRSK